MRMGMATMKLHICLFLSLVVLGCLPFQPALGQILLQVRDCTIHFRHEFPFAKQAGAAIQCAPIHVCGRASAGSHGTSQGPDGTTSCRARSTTSPPPGSPMSGCRRRRTPSTRKVDLIQSQLRYILYQRNVRSEHRKSSHAEALKKTLSYMRMQDTFRGGCTT